LAVKLKLEIFELQLSDLPRWSLRCSIQSHIQSTTCSTNSNRNWSNSFCLHSPIDHASILESTSYVPQVQVLLGLRYPRHR